jgi:hypothetical protein
MRPSLDSHLQVRHTLQTKSRECWSAPACSCTLCTAGNFVVTVVATHMKPQHHCHVENISQLSMPHICCRTVPAGHHCCLRRNEEAQRGTAGAHNRAAGALPGVRLQVRVVGHSSDVLTQCHVCTFNCVCNSGNHHPSETACLTVSSAQLQQNLHLILCILLLLGAQHLCLHLLLSVCRPMLALIRQHTAKVAGLLSQLPPEVCHTPT